MTVAVPFQRVKLEVAHHGIQLYHTVGDRGPRGESNTTPAGDLVHVTAFAVHIAGFLRVRLSDARHTAHFCV